MTAHWMLYGPTGYTGRLVLEECARRGLRPVLGGRNAAALAALAGAHGGLAHRALPLDDPRRLVEGLAGLRLVLHCAGPFSRTSAPMRAACIEAGVHYLDITGEIDVFEAARADDEKARAAGVLLCPGVGFDVVPTDCLAASLARALPGATRLHLGFSGVDHMSAGTLATSMEAVRRGASRVRRGGHIVDVPFGQDSRMADFGRGPEKGFVIPWGDVSTAGCSTGIGDIAVHIPWQSPGARAIRALLPFRALMASPAAVGITQWLLRRLAPGPGARRREQETCRLWAEVSDAAGHTRTAVLHTPNGYTLTVLTALMAVEHVLGEPVEPGFRTPSQVLGADCLERLGLRIELGA